MTNRAIRLIIGLGSSSVVALLANYCASRSHFNLPAAGFIDLLIVFLTALKFGFWEATGSSFAAVASLDFFFAPPIHSFRLYDPENWVALVTFEIIALIVSRLSNQLRNEGESVHRSEKELRDLLETMPAIAFVARPDGFNEFQSRGWMEYSGLSAESSLGYGWSSAIHPVDLDPQMSKWEASKVSGEPLEVEARHRNANGEYRWFLTRAVPFRDEQGKILKWYGVLTDIDDRKRAECLLAGEKRILEMVATGDSLGQILEALCLLVEEQVSGSLASIALLDGDHLRRGGAPSLPIAYIDALDGSANGPLASFCATAARRGEQVIVEDIATDPLWANHCDLALQFSLRACWSTPVFSSQGKVMATFAMYFRKPRRPSLRDQELIKKIAHMAQVVIERKQIQEALRRSEAHLAQAQRLTHTGSWARSPMGDVYWSEEMFRIWGFEVMERPPDRNTVLKRVHPDDRESARENGDKAMRDGTGIDHEYRIILPDGTVRHIHAVGRPIHGASGELVEMVGTVMDVTERKRAEEKSERSEEALRRSEAHLSQAQRLTHTGSWSRSPKGDAAFWSEEMFQIWGFDLMERPPGPDTYLQRVHPDDRDKFENGRKAMRGGAGIDDEYRIVLPDGTVKHIHVVGRPIFSASGEMVEGVGTAVDITDRKRAEEERERLIQLEATLAHMNRVSVMGEMSASLAHEVNQPLAGIVSNGGACLNWLGGDSPNLGEAREAARRIVRDGKRAGEIISRIRALASKAVTPKAKIDLNETIGEVLALVGDETKRRSIALRKEFANALAPVFGDRVQLQQVVLNIIMNALDAMNNTECRRLLIATCNDDAGHVAVAVQDTGTGLDPSAMEKVFQPFYSTKPYGMGMGLSISSSIIQSHGGRLWVTVNDGPGVTIHFSIPQYKEEASVD